MNYVKPAAEALAAMAATAMLDASLEGNLEGYGDEQDFTW